MEVTTAKKKTSFFRPSRHAIDVKRDLAQLPDNHGFEADVVRTISAGRFSDAPSGLYGCASSAGAFQTALHLVLEGMSAMEYLDFGTLIFIVAAVAIFLRLRSVLGQRTGNERPPRDPFHRPDADGKAAAGDGDNVVTLPRRKTDAPEAAETLADIEAVAPAASPLNRALRDIREKDASFAPSGFVAGAKLAYEMIVLAFADGDRKTLKNLLSREVFDGFSAALDERAARGEKVQSSFVGIKDAKIVGAELKGSEANLTLRIVSEIITATIGKDGAVIEGDPETVTEVNDVWTFARDLKSRDPNWKLVATEADD
jgi:predicted lipid-binding transport protein (Tim44 family)